MWHDTKDEEGCNKDKGQPLVCARTFDCAAMELRLRFLRQVRPRIQPVPLPEDRIQRGRHAIVDQKLPEGLRVRRCPLQHGAWGVGG